MTEEGDWRQLGAAELIRQYDNRSAVPEHPQIFADWAARSAATRERHVQVVELAYGEHPRERLDLFRPEAPDVYGAPGADSADDGDEAAALHLFIHGGYWQALDKSYFSFVAEPLLAAGETVAICGYPLCPEVGLGDIIASLRRALLRLRSRCPARRLIVSGHSAGGHLAAALLACEPGIDCAISLSGLFELEPLLATPVNDALRLDAGSARILSPALWPTPAADGKLLLAVGERESGEYYRQSRLQARAWGGRLQIAERVAPDCNHFSILDWFCKRYPAL